jgi:hypothetical protein
LEYYSVADFSWWQPPLLPTFQPRKTLPGCFSPLRAILEKFPREPHQSYPLRDRFRVHRNCSSIYANGGPRPLRTCPTPARQIPTELAGKANRGSGLDTRARAVIDRSRRGRSSRACFAIPRQMPVRSWSAAKLTWEISRPSLNSRPGLASFLLTIVSVLWVRGRGRVESQCP